MVKHRLTRQVVRCISGAIAVAWAVFILPSVGAAQAKTPVSIELVFAVDTSASVDGFEYGLLMNGIASAFRRPEIIDLIEQQDGVAVALFQWSSDVDEKFMIPWHLLEDRADILSFAAAVEGARRDPDRRFTAIGGAIDFGVRLIAENAFDGRQLKIDVSGDGRNNVGISPSFVWQRANALGIVINGLPIITSTSGNTADLDRYYFENVVRGPGAFVETANDYDDFARAFLRKLGREIAPAVSHRKAPPGASVQNALAGQPESRR